jgi:hypothetical protein
MLSILQFWEGELSTSEEETDLVACSMDCANVIRDRQKKSHGKDYDFVVWSAALAKVV